MKDAEDEAFDDIARRQGAWGGGYQAKRNAAMDKINSDFDKEYKKSSAVLAKYRIDDDDDIQDYKRPWVGIDWSEIPNEEFNNYHFNNGAKWAEKHLKEKNT